MDRHRHTPSELGLRWPAVRWSTAQRLAWTTYADESGKLNDPGTPIVVLAMIQMPCNLEPFVGARLAHLRRRIGQRVGADPASVEFHADKIIRGKGPFKGFDSADREDILARLRYALCESCRLTAVVMLKEQGAEETLRKMRENVKTETNAAIGPSGSPLRLALDSLLSSSLRKKGLGQLGMPVGLLLGLTSGLLTWERVRTPASLILDRNFVQHMGGLHLVTQLANDTWRLMPQIVKFPLWPDNLQPRWLLGTAPQEAESSDWDGLQLADFAAYTIRSLFTDPDSIGAHTCPIAKHRVVFLPDMPGIGLAACRLHEPPRTSRKVKQIAASP